MQNKIKSQADVFCFISFLIKSMIISLCNIDAANTIHSTATNKKGIVLIFHVEI